MGKPDDEKKEFQARFAEVADSSAKNWHRQWPPGSLYVSDHRAGKFQYVDLVLGGGAMLGIAHAGYIHAMEEAGIRFHALAGTSAGALSAGLMFALGPPSDPKGLKLAVTLATMPIDRFLGRFVGRWYFKSKYQWKQPLATAFFAFLGLIRIVLTRHLITGDNFENWLADEFRRLQGDGWKDKLSPDRPISFEPNADSRASRVADILAFVASDISTESQLVFPRHEYLFVNDSENRNLARYIRASTTVPFVFKPLTVTYNDSGQETARNVLGLRFTPPKEIKLVDGGLMSNFPISLFHAPPEAPPRRPTFGVRFDTRPREKNRTDSIVRFIPTIFKTALDVADDQFIRQHPDFQRLVTAVDTGDIDPFNVYMDADTKVELFKLGYEAGRRFLCGDPEHRKKPFDWPDYKQLRQHMHPEQEDALRQAR